MTPPEPQQATRPKIDSDAVLEKAKGIEIKNILRKLNSGKTLTAREREMLFEWGDEQKRGKNLNGADLARKWGITRQAVHKYVKAGMPLTSFAEAEQWRNDHIDKGSSGVTHRGINEAKLENLRLEAEKRRIHISRMENEQIDLRKAQQFCSEVLTRLAQSVMYLEGMTRDQASYIAEQMRQEAVRLSDDLATAIFDDGEEIFDGEEEEKE